MLSSLAVWDTLSSEFCIMVAKESFWLSSIVGLNLSKNFLSSFEGSEAAIFLLARDVNAAIKRGMGRILGLTYKSTEYEQ